jgi:hypothetical protein
VSETPEVATLEVLKTVCDNWQWFDDWADAITPEKP